MLFYYEATYTQPLDFALFHKIITRDKYVSRRIFLHIGLDKTGTTSLQRFFSRHVEDLPHILFPILDGSFSPAKKVEFSHHLFAEAFFGNTNFKRVINSSRLVILQKESPEVMMDDILTGLKQQLDDTKDDDRPAIISSEALSRDNLNHNALYEFLKPYDVTIVAFLRRQDEYAKSKYSQYIKHKSRLRRNINAKKFEEFLDPNWLNYHDKLSKWVRAGFKPEQFKIVPFERERMPDGIIPYFFDELGLDLKNLPVNSFAVNKSLNDFEVMSLQWFVSRIDVSDDMKREIVSIAIKNSGELDGMQNVTFITKKMRQQILEQYSKSNSQIVKDFMLEYKGDLFSDVILDDKEGLEELDLEKVKNYIAQLENMVEADV